MTGEALAAKGPYRYQAFWVGLILLLGLGLRLSGLVWGQGYFYFGQGDGVEAYSVAVDYGQGSPRAMYLGQPNYNAHSKLPGPLWTLFCYGACRIWGSAEGIVLGVILLNTAAIGLIYLLARRTVGATSALWAALFAATFPWVVYYSSGVYNPEVMSFLGALLFLALWQTSQVERAKSIFWVPLLLLMMPQFHMSGLMLIPAAALVLALCPTRLRLGWLAAGMACGLALYIPYLRGESAHGWQNTHGMFGGGGAGYSYDGLKALSAPLSFLVNWAPRWTRSAADYRELGRACFGAFWLFLAVNALSVLMAGFLLAGGFVQVRQAMRGFLASPRQTFARSGGLVMLALLLFVPLLFALVAGKSFHTRYCIVLLPALLPLAGAAAAHWLCSLRLGRLFQVGLILLCCANIWLMPAMYRFQDNQIEHGPAFIPSFRKMETVYRALQSHAGPGARIQVDDTAYVTNPAIPEPVRHDAALLRPFVEIRERERRAQSGNPGTVVYRLCASVPAPAEESAVAYRGNGIALVCLAPRQ
jgi:hypothetical protein